MSYVQDQSLDGLVKELLDTFQRIGKMLQEHELDSQKAGSRNDFGDEQLQVDLETDKLLFDCLRKTGVVNYATSEENPVQVDCGGDLYCVAFDPLDGSSIMECNLTVGTVMGIWKGDIIGQTGRDQVLSIMAVYGPATKVVIGIPTQGSFEYIYKEGWKMCKQFRIQPTTIYFAPGNLRAVNELDGYRRLLDYYIQKKYTLRYTGGIVPDVYHILVKGSGVYTSPVSSTSKAKLRLAFEVAPIAMIVELAGGESIFGSQSILDIVIDELDQRIGVCLGSTEEIIRFREYMQ